MPVYAKTPKTNFIYHMQTYMIRLIVSSVNRLLSLFAKRVVTEKALSASTEVGRIVVKSVKCV